jgi:hypothetical protein
MLDVDIDDLALSASDLLDQFRERGMPDTIQRKVLDKTHEANDLAKLKAGPKGRPAGRCFRTAPGPLSVLVLVAVKNPKNEAKLESIQSSFSDNLI